MGSLFKYLPAQYADHLLNGEILCRNLVYFRKIEGDPRADISEGTHIDAPHHDVQLMNMTTGQTITGRFAYHNVLKNIERVFCCLYI